LETQHRILEAACQEFLEMPIIRFAIESMGKGQRSDRIYRSSETGDLIGIGISVISAILNRSHRDQWCQNFPSRTRRNTILPVICSAWKAA